MTEPVFEVADSREWLRGKKNLGAVISSLPDETETPFSLEEWKAWFVDSVVQLLEVADPSAPVVLYQTDRKAKGLWISKADLIFRAAERAGARVLWHKIVLRREPGDKDLFRPCWISMIALSMKGRPGKATADVIRRGRCIYPNAMGLNAALLAARFVQEGGHSRVIDPYCGRGTIPAVCAAIGLEAHGLDIDPEQIEHAKRLRISLPTRSSE
jgi:hypothetical protein